MQVGIRNPLEESKQVPDNAGTDHWPSIDSEIRFCQFGSMNWKFLSGFVWLSCWWNPYIARFYCICPSKSSEQYQRSNRKLLRGSRMRSDRWSVCRREGTNTLKRSTSTHGARKQVRRETKTQFPIKQKNLGITFIAMMKPAKQICLKVSQLFWRLGILRLFLAFKTRSLCLEKCLREQSIGRIFWNKKFGALDLLVWLTLPNRFIWMFLVFSGDLSLCVWFERTGSCRSLFKTGKWFDLNPSPRQSLLERNEPTSDRMT